MITYFQVVLLRTDFFPHVPCAIGLSFCPLGYRIPALEDDIKMMLEEGRSFVAVDEGIIRYFIE